MVKRNDKTNTGEGDKGKKGRTVSDDAGERDKTQYFVDKVKDKRRTKNNEITKVQEDLYGNKLGMLKQECKTRWSSTHNLRIIFDEVPGNHSAVLCVRETDFQDWS